MKKVFLLITVLLFVTYLSGLAQTATPKANLRQGAQQVRIAEGVQSGELTRAERKVLKKEQRHIRRTKRRAKADGEVTVRERRKINRKQHRANRHIKRQKHDGQTKG